MARSISIQNLSERLSVPPTGDELQRLSETLNEMLSRLNDSVQRITQFTADASHELRAPIALIRTTAELTLGRRRQPEEYEQAMKEVLIESERTSHLLDGLLALARGDSGVDGLECETIDIAECMEEAVSEGRRFADEKQIKVSCELPERVVNINGDPNAIRRVFLILIDNAVKYTAPAGQIRVSLHTRVDRAEATVTDTGIGIAPEDQAHIFDRFWRADKVRSRETGGVGLGLSIARWIVEQHHGTITVESELGKGSVFCVSFPLAVPEVEALKPSD
jgi:signal transduction histidine kinase